MTDAAIKDEKEETIEATPLYLLFGQGHQHFLERLANVPVEPVPPRSKGKTAKIVTAEECLVEALFFPVASARPNVSNMKVRDVIRLIEADGWFPVRTRGTHRQYKHGTK
jgi:hypothetical protein